jgi:hypothetical protein
MHRHVTVDVFGVEGDVGIGIWQVEVNIRIGSNVVVYWLLPNSVPVPTQITPFDNTIELHLRGSGILPSKVHVLEGKDRRGYIYLSYWVIQRQLSLEIGKSRNSDRSRARATIYLLMVRILLPAIGMRLQYAAAKHRRDLRKVVTHFLGFFCLDLPTSHAINLK